MDLHLVLQSVMGYSVGNILYLFCKDYQYCHWQWFYDPFQKLDLPLVLQSFMAYSAGNTRHLSRNDYSIVIDNGFMTLFRSCSTSHYAFSDINSCGTVGLSLISNIAYKYVYVNHCFYVLASWKGEECQEESGWWVTEGVQEFHRWVTYHINCFLPNLASRRLQRDRQVTGVFSTCKLWGNSCLEFDTGTCSLNIKPQACIQADKMLRTYRVWVLFQYEPAVILGYSGGPSCDMRILKEWSFIWSILGVCQRAVSVYSALYHRYVQIRAI